MSIFTRWALTLFLKLDSYTNAYRGRTLTNIALGYQSKLCLKQVKKTREALMEELLAERKHDHFIEELNLDVFGYFFSSYFG